MTFSRVGEGVTQKECPDMDNEICGGITTLEKFDSYIKS